MRRRNRVMANFTKREIKKTFAELLNQKPLSKISVKDIVDRCGVSRNTFYYYFEDIPTLLNSIVADQADELIKNHSTFDSLEDCVDVIFKYALENKKAVLHVYQSLGREIYDDFLVKACGYAVTEHIKILTSDLNISDDQRNAVIKFTKCTLIGACIDWISEGMKDDYTEDFHRLSRMCRELLDSFVEQHKK